MKTVHMLIVLLFALMAIQAVSGAPRARAARRSRRRRRRRRRRSRTGRRRESWWARRREARRRKKAEEAASRRRKAEAKKAEEKKAEEKKAEEKKAEEKKAEESRRKRAEGGNKKAEGKKTKYSTCEVSVARNCQKKCKRKCDNGVGNGPDCRPGRARFNNDDVGGVPGNPGARGGGELGTEYTTSDKGNNEVVNSELVFQGDAEGTFRRTVCNDECEAAGIRQCKGKKAEEKKGEEKKGEKKAEEGSRKPRRATGETPSASKCPARSTFECNKEAEESTRCDEAQGGRTPGIRQKEDCRRVQAAFCASNEAAIADHHRDICSEANGRASYDKGAARRAPRAWKKPCGRFCGGITNKWGVCRRVCYEELERSCSCEAKAAEAPKEPKAEPKKEKKAEEKKPSKEAEEIVKVNKKKRPGQKIKKVIIVKENGDKEVDVVKKGKVVRETKKDCPDLKPKLKYLKELLVKVKKHKIKSAVVKEAQEIVEQNEPAAPAPPAAEPAKAEPNKA